MGSDGKTATVYDGINGGETTPGVFLSPEGLAVLQGMLPADVQIQVDSTGRVDPTSLPATCHEYPFVDYVRTLAESDETILVEGGWTIDFDVNPSVSDSERQAFEAYFHNFYWNEEPPYVDASGKVFPGAFSALMGLTLVPPGDPGPLWSKSGGVEVHFSLVDEMSFHEMSRTLAHEFFGHAYAYVMGLPSMHNQAGFREWSALIDDIWLSGPGGLGF